MLHMLKNFISIEMNKNKYIYRVKILLKFVMYSIYDQCDKFNLDENLKLKDSRLNEKCFILGNSVSLNDIKLCQLKNVDTFGCNMIMLHREIKSLDLSYYVCCDSLTGLIRSRQPYEKPEVFFDMIDSTFTSSKPVCFFHNTVRKFLNRNNLLSTSDVHYLKPRHDDILSSSNSLEGNICNRNSFMEGAFFSMISIAIFMGYKEIYLCGIGYSYKPIQIGHFYDDKGGLKNENVDKKHEIINDYAKTHGVKIFNVTPVEFESPVYNTITWKNVVEDVLNYK